MKEELRGQEYVPQGIQPREDGSSSTPVADLLKLKPEHVLQSFTKKDEK